MEKIGNERQNNLIEHVQPNPQGNPQPNQQAKSSHNKEEMNFEKLYMSIMEMKHESEKSLKIFAEFFKEFIEQNKSCNPTEILKFIKDIENNKQKINSSKN